MYQLGYSYQTDIQCNVWVCVFSINIVLDPVCTQTVLFLVISLSLFILKKIKMAFSLLREVHYLDFYSV